MCFVPQIEFCEDIEMVGEADDPILVGDSGSEHSGSKHSSPNCSESFLRALPFALLLTLSIRCIVHPKLLALFVFLFHGPCAVLLHCLNAQITFQCSITHTNCICVPSGFNSTHQILATALTPSTSDLQGRNGPYSCP